MNFIDRAIKAVSPARAFKRVQYRQAMAQYEAAEHGRRNDGWTPSRNGNPNIGLAGDLSTMRARSRDMVRNNPYASSALQVIVGQLFGTHGFQASVRSLDENANELTSEEQQKERRLKKWLGSTDIDYDCRNNGYGLQCLIGRAWKQDGEVLVIKYWDSSSEIPLRLRVIEVDMLDDTKDSIMTTGTDIVAQGIVFDRLTGRRKGYYIFDRHPAEMYAMSLTSTYVPADRVIHFYKQLRPGMIRGVPAGVASMVKLKNIEDFQDARLEQQKVAACFVGTIRRDSENMQGVDIKNDGDVLPDKLEPGMFARLNPWEAVDFNNPPQTTGHAEFLSFELHAVAADWGITYEFLTGDYSGVNFSSGKMGYARMDNMIQQDQEHVIKPLFLDQLSQWFNDAYALKFNDYDTSVIEWTAPARQMVDETKQIPALIKAIRGGLIGPFEAVRSLGRDPKHVLNDFKQWNSTLDELSVKLDSDPRYMTNSGQAQSYDEEDESTESIGTQAQSPSAIGR